MISVYHLKPAFQKFLQPVLHWLYKMGVTANQLTLVAIILSVAMGFCFSQYQIHHSALLIIPIGFFLRMVLNALDGMMARQYNMHSQLGEVLNELGDVISDICIIFPFIIIPGINPLIIVLFGVLAILNEFSGVLSKALGKGRRYDGPMGKSDRALFLGLFCLIDFFWSNIELYANWIFGAACAMVLLSTFTRLRKAF
ncbi:MAG: CDP-alcohol phosphatidyltransferase family protein [Flammeovirgaceae bacterium]|jgi:CDP-diacylglycerol---glycerol-3-phosphate 3-phosphatidyltransferase|nr:CDP-alcohol phosphatidyltransferase family protein [Flammeovirgaceae bacterium]